MLFGNDIDGSQNAYFFQLEGESWRNKRNILGLCEVIWWNHGECSSPSYDIMLLHFGNPRLHVSRHYIWNASHRKVTCCMLLRFSSNLKTKAEFPTVTSCHRLFFLPLLVAFFILLWLEDRKKLNRRYHLSSNISTTLMTSARSHTANFCDLEKEARKVRMKSDWPLHYFQ